VVGADRQRGGGCNRPVPARPSPQPACGLTVAVDRTRGHHVAHFGDSGIRAMLRRRGKQAGVQNCYPHRFRHTFADSWLALGGNVDDLMNVAGWKSISMPLRYAKSRGIARAAEAHKRLSPGDRLSC
jgi:integrase